MPYFSEYGSLQVESCMEKEEERLKSACSESCSQLDYPDQIISPLFRLKPSAGAPCNTPLYLPAVLQQNMA